MATKTVVKEEPLTPEAVLPRMKADTEEMINGRAVFANEVRKRLTLDPSKMSFVSRDTYPITWRDENGIHEILLPLRSLTADESEAILDEFRGIDRPSEDSPEYVVVMTNMIISAQYEKILKSFDGELLSLDGTQVVWSVDEPALCNHDAALESLKALKIPGLQLQEIADFIDTISRKTEAEKEQDFKKK